MNIPPIFLTQESDVRQTRYYLWKLIPSRSLVITQDVFAYFNHFDYVKTLLPDLNGQTIYLDLSYSPEVLESPHTIGVFDALKQLGPLKIVVNEYKKFYHPHNDFIFFPMVMYTISHGAYHHPEMPFRFPKFAKKTKPFMSLNNRPVWHRIWLFAELAKHNLLEHVDYSFVWDPKINVTGMEHQMDQLPETIRTAAEAQLHRLPLRFEHEKHLNFNADTLTNLNLHNECAVNIVTESCPNLGFLSEKICKPLACYQIPILLSHAGANQFCVDAGFDMFEDIIPWRTWDSIPDDHLRCEVACQFVVEYIKRGGALEDWNRCQDRVVANQNRLLSDDFKKLCIAQFKL